MVSQCLTQNWSVGDISSIGQSVTYAVLAVGDLRSIGSMLIMSHIKIHIACNYSQYTHILSINYIYIFIIFE